MTLQDLLAKFNRKYTIKFETYEIALEEVEPYDLLDLQFKITLLLEEHIKNMSEAKP